MKALFTTLKWQQHELTHDLFITDQRLESVTQAIHAVMKHMSKSYTLPALILPEMEMARANFITQQQLEHDELTVRKAALQAKKTGLQLQQTRLNMKLKQLEKHQNNKLKIQHQYALLTQQNTIDEWALQRRGIK